MSNLVPADIIEKLVGVPRYRSRHVGRAVSESGVFYILHSTTCLMRHPDLRLCPFSISLDRGLDVDSLIEDEPVFLSIADGHLRWSALEL